MKPFTALSIALVCFAVSLSVGSAMPQASVAAQDVQDVQVADQDYAFEQAPQLKLIPEEFQVLCMMKRDGCVCTRVGDRSADQDSAIEQVPQLKEIPLEFQRRKRITCDLLSGLGWGNSLCAGHCMAISWRYRGGYCNSQGVCVCRS